MTEAISNLGFPIAACIALAWYVRNRDKAHKEEIEKRDKLHKEEIDKLSNVVENNTLVLNKIYEHIEGADNGKE